MQITPTGPTGFSSEMSTFLKTTDSYQAGARTMPQEYYASPEVFAREREQVFAQQWICVGRTRDFVEPGTYRLADIAGESLIVVRDRTGVIRADQLRVAPATYESGRWKCDGKN